MFNKVPEQDPFAVSNDAEENIKLFPSFKVSVKFSLPYHYYYINTFCIILWSNVRLNALAGRSNFGVQRPLRTVDRHFPCSMGSSETNNILLFKV